MSRIPIASRQIIRHLLPLLVLTLITAQAGAQQLRLETLLSSVGETHPRIRAAMAEIDLQRGRKLQAIAPPAPSLTFHEEEIPSGATLGEGKQRIWQVSQGFDLPLLLGARGYAYGHLQDAAGYRLDVARAMVRADIVSAYAAWYARLQQLRLQEENHVLAAEFSRKAQLRHERGESGALEAARARAEEASARISLEHARVALNDAAAALSLASARDIPTPRSDVPSAWDPAAIADTLPSLDGTRLAALPDMDGSALALLPLTQSAREERDAARANASWRWMEFLPRFEAAWFRQDFKDLGPHWGAELTASIPLWFLLDTRGSIEEHQAAATQADAAYEETLRALGHRVRQARRMLQAAAATMQAYDTELVLEARRIARAAELGYDSGEIGYMEYLSARQSANAISIGYHDALAALYAAAAEYEFVTGTLILE